MSGKYAPIAGYPDGVYNFGPRYVTLTPTREPSTDLAPPRNLQFAPEGKKEWNHAVRWLHARTHARTRANAFPPTQNAPRTHH